LPAVTKVLADTLEIAIQKKIGTFTLDECEQMLADDSVIQQYLQRASKLNDDNNDDEKFFNAAKKSNIFNKKAVSLLEKASIAFKDDGSYDKILEAWGLT
jgi:hypothetical protein